MIVKESDSQCLSIAAKYTSSSCFGRLCRFLLFGKGVYAPLKIPVCVEGLEAEASQLCHARSLGRLSRARENGWRRTMDRKPRPVGPWTRSLHVTIACPRVHACHSHDSLRPHLVHQSMGLVPAVKPRHGCRREAAAAPPPWKPRQAAALARAWPSGRPAVRPCPLRCLVVVRLVLWCGCLAASPCDDGSTTAALSPRAPLHTTPLQHADSPRCGPAQTSIIAERPILKHQQYTRPAAGRAAASTRPATSPAPPP
jgi:hypothetical protein